MLVIWVFRASLSVLCHQLYSYISFRAKFTGLCPTHQVDIVDALHGIADHTTGLNKYPRSHTNSYHAPYSLTQQRPCATTVHEWCKYISVTSKERTLSCSKLQYLWPTLSEENNLWKGTPYKYPTTIAIRPVDESYHTNRNYITG